MSVKPVEVVEMIYGDSLPLHLLSSESWIFVKEKPDRNKSNNALQHVRTDFTGMIDGWKASWLFHDGGPY